MRQPTSVGDVLAVESTLADMPLHLQGAFERVLGRAQETWHTNQTTALRDWYDRAIANRVKKARSELSLLSALIRRMNDGRVPVKQRKASATEAYDRVTSAAASLRAIPDQFRLEL